MNRVVLDTNIIVSALLVPAGTQAGVLLLALNGVVALYVSSPILQEYEEVLRRPRFRLPARKIDGTMDATRPVSLSPDEADNRFLEMR